MFLTRVRSKRVLDERGSTLMAVIGVMAVLLIIGVTVVAATVSSLTFTSSTRAGVQSVAAAESGINVAELSLVNGTCQSQYTRLLAPAFTALVSYSLSVSNDVWVNGCPAAGVPAQRIKVVSTGQPAPQGVIGDPARHATSVEAIFGYVPAVLPGVHSSGAAMYLYGGVVFKNNANLFIAESGRAAIQVKQGNMTCENNTVIEGDVIVENGTLNISGCSIEGNAWASGAATLGHVTGNLTAGSVNVSAADLPSHVGGVYTQYTAGVPIPAVSDWVDFAYLPGDWIDSDGLPYKVTPIGLTCTLTASMLAAASNGSKPVIINALDLCPLGVKASGDVNLTNDLVVFGQSFDFTSQVRFKSSTTATHKLWFITPDTVANHLPTCGLLQGNFMMKNGFVIDSTIAAMLYTPCRFEAINNFEWRGQLYANGANDFKNNTRFDYVGLGLPGVDLDTGLRVPGGPLGSPAELGDRASVRDLRTTP